MTLTDVMGAVENLSSDELDELFSHLTQIALILSPSPCRRRI